MPVANTTFPVGAHGVQIKFNRCQLPRTDQWDVMRLSRGKKSVDLGGGQVAARAGVEPVYQP